MDGLVNKIIMIGAGVIAAAAVGGLARGGNLLRRI